MKWIVPTFSAAALAVLSLSVPSPIFTTEASADRMNGRGNCSGGACTKVSCPPKTCGRMGTPEAYDVRFCSAANCKK
jgi:hypothetical protein